MAEDFTFDPRLSLADLYDSLEEAEARARRGGQKMPTAAMRAVMDEIALRKKEGRL